MSRNPKGFTLTEVILALALVSAGMLGLAGALSQIIRANAVTRQRQTACFLAAAKLAQWRSTGLTDTGPLNAAFEPPFADFSHNARINYRSAEGRLADVTLEVRHKSQTVVRLWTQIRIANAP
jgi:prepilin-type N-terminal cleavage/methylation domain-containing protein